jgi:hypothetical protein
VKTRLEEYFAAVRSGIYVIAIILLFAPLSSLLFRSGLPEEGDD